MPDKKVTLKDIADRCGVTPTVVSAVLNGRSGRISCSAEKRELILRTAKELDYQVNIFARSIKIKHVPIVGLMLHLSEDEASNGLSSYVNNCLTNMTFAFNKHHLEVLFIPYSTEREQLERLKNLTGNGLIGGVVTNIIPESHKKICNYLASSPLPYMVLGAPLVGNIYCAYPRTPTLDCKLVELARMRGCRKSCQATLQDSKLMFRPYPFTNGYMWHTPPLTPEQIQAEKDNAFFAVMGTAVLNRLKKEAFVPRHFILVESFAFSHLIPENTDVILVSETASDMQIVTYAENSLYKWLEQGITPEKYAMPFQDSEKNFAIKLSQQKEK